MDTFKLFVKELRKTGKVPDHILRKLLEQVLLQKGDLPEFEELLLRHRLLSLEEIQRIKQRVTSSFRETQIQREVAKHSEELLEDLQNRLAEEIQREKEEESRKMEELRKKATSLSLDPLAVVVKEIRKQSWCSDLILRQVLKEVLEKKGGVKELFELLLSRKVLHPGQISYLASFLKETIQEKRKKMLPKKDALSELEESLGAEIPLETKKHKPTSFSFSPSSPKPHSSKVKILSEDEGVGFFDLSDEEKGDEEERGGELLF